MRSSRSALFAVTAAVVGMAAGCASKPCQKPRVLSSYSPAGAPSAPPLNARAPIRVPTAPVGTPVAAIPSIPVTTVVPASPGIPVGPAPAMAIPAQPAPQLQQAPAGQYVPAPAGQQQYTQPPTGQSYQQTPQLQPLPAQQQQPPAQPQPNGNSSYDNRQGNGAEAYDDVEPQRPLVAPSPPST